MLTRRIRVVRGSSRGRGRRDWRNIRNSGTAKLRKAEFEEEEGIEDRLEVEGVEGTGGKLREGEEEDGVLGRETDFEEETKVE